jgi:hypothetical protein
LSFVTESNTDAILLLAEVKLASGTEHVAYVLFSRVALTVADIPSVYVHVMLLENEVPRSAIVSPGTTCVLSIDVTTGAGMK